MRIWGSADLLRRRDGHEAKVSFEELFFDLIYAFAVTQLSHRLLEHLTVLGAVETLVPWFAVWLGWQYTSWVTNWFDPETLPIRLMLFAIMLAGLVMAAAIPEAFAERGLVFAGCYMAIQVGRTLFILFHLGRSHALSPNFRRILGWLCISGAFWIAGGIVQGEARLALWIAAVACEYLSPLIGFWLPGLGRSRTSDWTIEGGHLAERCQSFVIVALGESIVVSGATLGGMANWNGPGLAAFLSAFIGSVAVWWIYFDTSSKAGSKAITHSKDPGRIGSWFHLFHVIIVGAVIVSAVADELVIAHSGGAVEASSLAVLIAGPALYLLGNALYKIVVYGWFPLSHMIGLAALAVLAPIAWFTDLLVAGTMTTLILIVVAGLESRSRRAMLRAGGAKG
jgi:low temperature requirement protein LtrA